MIDFVRFDRSDAELELFKHVDELLTVDHLDRRHTSPRRLAPCLSGERPGCQNDSLVGAASHSSAEVTDVRGRDGLAEALALEQNLEGDERIHGEGAVAIDASVATAPCYDDLREPSFTQDALAQPFEAGGWQLEEYVHDSTSVVLGRRP